MAHNEIFFDIGEIAVGIRHAGRLALNPDRDVEWRLEPGDQLLVLPRTAP